MDSFKSLCDLSLLQTLPAVGWGARVVAVQAAKKQISPLRRSRFRETASVGMTSRGG
jgi:hypothetical protein